MSVSSTGLIPTGTLHRSVIHRYVPRCCIDSVDSRSIQRLDIRLNCLVPVQYCRDGSSLDQAVACVLDYEIRVGDRVVPFVNPGERHVNVSAELLEYRPLHLDDLIPYLQQQEHLKSVPDRER